MIEIIQWFLSLPWYIFWAAVALYIVPAAFTFQSSTASMIGDYKIDKAAFARDSWSNSFTPARILMGLIWPFVPFLNFFWFYFEIFPNYFSGLMRFMDTSLLKPKK